MAIRNFIFLASVYYGKWSIAVWSSQRQCTIDALIWTCVGAKGTAISKSVGMVTWTLSLLVFIPAHYYTSDTGIRSSMQSRSEYVDCNSAPSTCWTLPNHVRPLFQLCYSGQQMVRCGIPWLTASSCRRFSTHQTMSTTSENSTDTFPYGPPTSNDGFWTSAKLEEA